MPVGNIIKIADIIEQFVDQFHYNKEESGYFPEAENREEDRFSEEIRKFVIEYKFGRRIAKRIRIHLEEYVQGKDGKEPLARYLKMYSVFIQDLTLQKRTGSSQTLKKDDCCRTRKKGHLSRNLSA